MAIKPDLFLSLDEFKSRMDYLYQRCTSAAKAQGVDRIYFTGELEIIAQREREKSGIPYTRGELAELDKEAELVGAGPVRVR
jgi:LDH2 family malate/lactate/ureidoglycolate dehydrogenase